MVIAQAGNQQTNHFLKDQRFDQIYGRFVFVIRNVSPEYLSLAANDPRFAREQSFESKTSDPTEEEAKEMNRRD